MVQITQTSHVLLLTTTFASRSQDDVHLMRPCRSPCILCVNTVRVPRQIATPPGSLSPRLLDFGGRGGVFTRLFHHLRHLAAHLAEEAGGRLRDGLHVHGPIALPPRRRRRRALNAARSTHTIRSFSSAVVRVVRVCDLLVLLQFLQLLQSFVVQIPPFEMGHLKGDSESYRMLQRQ